ncbi:hypothetical protein HYH03_002088 [Edaphochlamys debaryana]|uniref:Uncharacterized protein n=1 Tax=Edaphochlamys debaryana TaxID=47281 RepID=A0A835YF80_9CHLO|nr:hypothetical protein HYH03_002088 [Edaphochlamys debaryana]|eukprot:KAG2499791.1 hypothetical protein HYH03_002088 [Edaphochlamys debaryana]
MALASLSAAGPRLAAPRRPLPLHPLLPRATTRQRIAPVQACSAPTPLPSSGWGLEAQQQPLPLREAAPDRPAGGARGRTTQPARAAPAEASVAPGAPAATASSPDDRPPLTEHLDGGRLEVTEGAAAAAASPWPPGGGGGPAAATAAGAAAPSNAAAATGAAAGAAGTFNHTPLAPALAAAGSTAGGGATSVTAVGVRLLASLLAGVGAYAVLCVVLKCSALDGLVWAVVGATGVNAGALFGWAFPHQGTYLQKALVVLAALLGAACFHASPLTIGTVVILNVQVTVVGCLLAASPASRRAWHFVLSECDRDLAYFSFGLVSGAIIFMK